VVEPRQLLCNPAEFALLDFIPGAAVARDETSMGVVVLPEFGLPLSQPSRRTS
jgi:hypothetical protein